MDNLHVVQNMEEIEYDKFSLGYFIRMGYFKDN